MACGAGPSPAGIFRERQPDVIEFVYGTTEGTEFSSRSTRGRATAVLFVTTYDLASQVMARRLDEVVHYHKPRANAGAVVLEAPKYALFADAFRTTLGLSYPVAIADDETRARRGPFGKIDRVPTLVVLSRSGREVWRRSGVSSPKQIEQALAEGSAGGLE